jgi:Lipocalin-like domain
MITVCSYCLRASCWRRKFYCDHAKSAGITELLVKTLKKLKLEHPDFWNPAISWAFPYLRQREPTPRRRQPKTWWERLRSFPSKQGSRAGEDCLTYSVSETDKTYTHVESCTFPNWNGAERKYSFDISGDELSITVLSAPSATKGIVHLVWKRAK